MRFVVANSFGRYLRTTGAHSIREGRVTTWEADLQLARVFATKGSATAAARHAGERCFAVVPVEIITR